MDTGLMEERSDRGEQDKGKEGQMIISMRENISKPPLGCAELYRYAYHHRPHRKVPTNKETHRGVQSCTHTSG